jgi:cytoskeletal protein RodZ
MYDLSLATNPDAYLPVNLALIKLGIKYVVHSSGKQLFSVIDPQQIVTSVLKPKLAVQRHIPGNLPPSAHLEDHETVKKSKAAWDGLYSEVVLIMGLAALVSILFLWRQILAQQDIVRRMQAQPPNAEDNTNPILTPPPDSPPSPAARPVTPQPTAVGATAGSSSVTSASTSTLETNSDFSQNVPTSEAETIIGTGGLDTKQEPAASSSSDMNSNL